MRPDSSVLLAHSKNKWLPNDKKKKDLLLTRYQISGLESVCLTGVQNFVCTPGVHSYKVSVLYIYVVIDVLLASPPTENSTRRCRTENGNWAIISFTPSFRRLSLIPGAAAVAGRVFCRSPAVVERPVAIAFLFTLPLIPGLFPRGGRARAGM